MAHKPKGWGMPQLSKKAHYFVNGQSLCNRWMYLGELEDARHTHPQNCASCQAKREKLNPPKGATV